MIYRLITFFFSGFQGDHVPVLGTTNKIELIDEAFRRRLGSLYHIGLPGDVSFIYAYTHTHTHTHTPYRVDGVEWGLVRISQMGTICISILERLRSF